MVRPLRGILVGDARRSCTASQDTVVLPLTASVPLLACFVGDRMTKERAGETVVVGTRTGDAFRLRFP